jgi:hypothetical protein
MKRGGLASGGGLRGCELATGRSSSPRDAGGYRACRCGGSFPADLLIARSRREHAVPAVLRLGRSSLGVTRAVRPRLASRARARRGRRAWPSCARSRAWRGWRRLPARLLHRQGVGALTGRAAFPAHRLRSRNRLPAAAQLDPPGSGQGIAASRRKRRRQPGRVVVLRHVVQVPHRRRDVRVTHPRLDAAQVDPLRCALRPERVTQVIVSPSIRNATCNGTGECGVALETATWCPEWPGIGAVHLRGSSQI